MHGAVAKKSADRRDALRENTRSIMDEESIYSVSGKPSNGKLHSPSSFYGSWTSWSHHALRAFRSPFNCRQNGVWTHFRKSFSFVFFFRWYSLKFGISVKDWFQNVGGNRWIEATGT